MRDTFGERSSLKTPSEQQIAGLLNINSIYGGREASSKETDGNTGPTVSNKNGPKSAAETKAKEKMTSPRILIKSLNFEIPKMVKVRSRYLILLTFCYFFRYFSLLF
jgi:hypothetical protein